MPIPSLKAFRQVLPVVAVLAAATVWCAPASGADFVFERPDGTTREVTFDELDELGVVPEDTHFDVRRRPGPATRIPVENAYYLRDVLKALGGLAPTLQTVRIGIWEDPPGLEQRYMTDMGYVRARQLDSVLYRPALYEKNGKVFFIRNSTGTNDVSLHIEVAPGDLQVMARDSSSFELGIRGRSKAKAGEQVDFSVRAKGSDVGAEIAYTWKFGDGSEAEGTTVSHTFTSERSYTVRVVATLDNEEDSDIVLGRASHDINVGEAKPSEVDRGGGGDNESTGAPPTSTYDGDSGAGSSYGSSTATSDSTGDSGFDAITSDSDPLAGDTVEGTLLASVDTPVDGSTTAALRAARTGDPDFDVPEADSALPPAAWAGLGALALMGAGAGLESGRRPRPRWPARLRPGALRR